MHSNCWVDTITFGAILKSLDCTVAVVVIDHDIKEPLCLLFIVVSHISSILVSSAGGHKN